MSKPTLKQPSAPQVDNNHIEFNDPSADVVFVSSDGVKFHIHEANLQVAAPGFSPDLIKILAKNGTVSLTETAATLELLFAFLYPKRHPTLTGINLGTLELVAEAAEKYEVYAAMSVCVIRMKEKVKEDTIEVLNFAFKHGYTDLINEAGPLTINISFQEIADRMAPSLLAPWLRYYQRWITIKEPPSLYTLPFHYSAETLGECRRWSEALTELGIPQYVQLNWKQSRLHKMPNESCKAKCGRICENLKRELIVLVSSVGMLSNLL